MKRIATILIITLTTIIVIYTYNFRLLLDTGSMEPLLQGGDIIITVDYTGNAENGDIIAFDGVLHRIVDIDEKGYTTMGDANLTPDVGYRQESDIDEIYVARVRLGVFSEWIADYITNKYGRVAE